MVAEGETLPTLFDDERRDAAGTNVRGSDCKDDIDVSLGRIGDENFAAVEQVMVALVDRGGLGTACIRTGVGFGQTERTDFFALCQRNKVFLFLLFGAKGKNRPRAERNMRGQDNAGAAVHARELFDCDGVAQHIQTGSAVLGGVGNTHKTQLTQLFHSFCREFVCLIHAECMGLDFFFCKCPYFCT